MAICHLVLTALAIVLSVIGLVTLLNITEGPYVYPGKLQEGRNETVDMLILRTLINAAIKGP